MINHIKKLAIIEDADPDNVVVLSNISEGVDGASTFGYETEETVMTIEDGQTIMDAIEHTLDIRTIIPDSGDSQLQTWTDNMTKVYVSAIGLDGGMLIGDAQTGEGTIRFYKDDQFSERKAIKIMATRKTVPGSDINTGILNNGILAGNNLALGYLWADADANGVADGWSASNFVSTSFASGQQTLEADTTLAPFVKGVWFPFEGEQVTFSLNIDSITGDYAENTLRMHFLDDTDTAVTQEFTDITATGRASITAIAPAGTVRIAIINRLQASSGTVTNVISDPALQLGTKTEYTTE